MRTATTTENAAPADALAAATTRRPREAVSEDLTVYTIDELASVLRCSQWTIRRGLQLGTFRPLPIKRRPFRWVKADIVAHLEALQKAAQAREQEQPARRRRRRRRARTATTTS